MSAHLKGWRLSACDEHTVMDGVNNQRLVSVPYGGVTGRTFTEAAEAARLIATAPNMREALQAIYTLGSDGEHSGDRHARCRDIARAALGEGERS